MPSFARRRDANEQLIVDALRAAGASVHKLTEKGCPDLLVGYAGATWLLEVKIPLGPNGGYPQHYDGLGGRGDLTADQVAWWDAWRGAPPVIVRSVAEALAAIGVDPASQSGASDRDADSDKPSRRGAKRKR